ncbi:MAG: GT2 family glycosyltransferase [Woeseiaceae bacterium]
MKLSIVTVNYRSFGHLENACSALAADFPDDWEMIVVDNESETAPLAEFQAKFPWVNCIANEINSGFGVGCRLGVAKAKGLSLLFMNPDVIADCRQIQQLIEEKDGHPDVAILAPKQTDSNGRAQKVFDDFPGLLNQSKLVKATLRALFPRRYQNPHADYKELTYCDWVTGSVLLIDRKNYDAIGGWSKDYWMYVEDADLCKKAHDAGMRIAYTPIVQVIHAHGGSSRLNVAVKSMTKLEVIISKHVYASKHARGPSRWLTHGLIIAMRLPMLVAAALADLFTLGQIPTLRVRSKMLLGLTNYYAGAIRTRSWLSPRAKANQSS